MIARIGDSVSFERIFSQSDFNRFARLSGDENPIHVDPQFAAGSHFGRTVCHGMLLYSTICSVLSSNLPNVGIQFRSLEMIFEAPTFADEQIAVNISVAGTYESLGMLKLTTNIVRSDGSFAYRGSADVSTGIWRSFPEKKTRDNASASASGELKGLRLGQKASATRTFYKDDLSGYIDLTQDGNPLFANKDYALEVGLENNLVPYGLLGGMFSHLLGMVLPGPGTNWLKQRLQFWSPAYPGDALTAIVEIIRLRPEKQLVNLATSIYRSDQNLACYGEALVLVRDL